MSFMGELEDICACVAKTGSPEASFCYPIAADCPNCGFTLMDAEELSTLGDNAVIREEIFKQKHTCVPPAQGGCDEDGTEYFLVPEYGCAIHETKGDSDCPKPEPLNPLMGPIYIKRSGEKTETKYNFSIALDESGYNGWVNFKPEAEIIEAFDKVSSQDLLNKRYVLSLEKQAEHFNTDFPFEDQYKSYGSEYDNSKEKKSNRGRRPQREASK
jgi:hypothetical protein